MPCVDPRKPLNSKLSLNHNTAMYNSQTSLHHEYITLAYEYHGWQHFFLPEHVHKGHSYKVTRNS